MVKKTQEIIDKKYLYLVKTEEKVEKLLEYLKKLNIFMKKLLDFSEKKPKKDFERLGIYNRPGLHVF